MIIKSLSLRNIRSYQSLDIDIPEGSVLLSGDIGSGKSTILLAIEFALFGIQRGNIEASDLLRHGSLEGNVELTFIVDGREYSIKRGLKRGKNGIAQTTGHIVNEGVVKEGSPVELRAIIIELLGYPAEMLTKNTGLVYRYTVYTPQEEMKLILSDNRETRLDVLRKVFGVDKYKRIREHCQMYVRNLRNKVARLEGGADGLDEKKEQLVLRQKENEEKLKEVKELEPLFEKYQKEYNEKKRIMDEYEVRIRKNEQRKKQISVYEEQIKGCVMQRQRDNKETEELQKQIKVEEEVLLKEKIDDSLGEKITERQKELVLFEKMKDDIVKEMSEIKAKHAHSERLLSRIKQIDECPTCMQRVTVEYKEGIMERERKGIDEWMNKLNRLDEKNQQIDADIVKLKESIEQLRKEEAKKELIKHKQQKLKMDKEKLERIKEDAELVKKKIGEINVQKMELQKELTQENEEGYKKAKLEVEEANVSLRKYEMQISGIKKESEGLMRIILELQKEIGQKEKLVMELKKEKKKHRWLTDGFMPLMGAMERQVMARVYNEFNDYFVNWFNLMIEDNSLQTRLDDEFTPMITQNGYDTAVGNLSGGEKTAVALAYRLSLNRVINELIGEIKTKELIILDEPTDGFSSEQLDNLRDVLDELKTKQTIIVSHESKIEGYVDKVLRISKDEHVSRIA